MTLHKLLFSLLGICLISLTTACSEDTSEFGDEFGIPQMTDKNTVQFTVDLTSGTRKQLEIFAIGGRIAIDWGDGRLQKIEDLKSLSGGIRYRFGNSKTYRVRIWAEELSFLSISGLLIPLRELQLGYLPNMTDLVINSFVGTTALDLSSSCPNLKIINIGNNADLEQIDISRCNQLETILLYTQPKLTALKFGSHPKLVNLHCSGTSLNTLSIKGLTEVRALDCSNNPNLLTLEVDDGQEISTLLCSNCAFEDMNWLNNLTYLIELSCNGNQLTELDLSKHTSLRHLSCSNNRLTRLTLPEVRGLRQLTCHSNQLGANMLNELFERLPNVTALVPPTLQFKICYYNNPGEDDCDKNIAKQRGWIIVGVDPMN